MASGSRRCRVHTTVAFGAHSDGRRSIVCSMSASEMLPNTPLASTTSAGTAPAYDAVSDASPQTTSTPGGAVARARCDVVLVQLDQPRLARRRRADARRARRSGRDPGPRTSRRPGSVRAGTRPTRRGCAVARSRGAARARCRDCRRPRCQSTQDPQSAWSLSPRALSRSTRRARAPRARTSGPKRAITLPSRPTRNFSKFHRMSPVCPSPSAVCVSSWYSGWRPVAVDLDLLRERERHVVVGAAERRDLVGAAGLLLAELVAGDADHVEALVLVLVLELLQPFVLRGQAAERRDVHHQRDLALLVGEHVGGAVEGGQLRVVQRHGNSFSVRSSVESAAGYPCVIRAETVQIERRDRAPLGAAQPDVLGLPPRTHRRGAHRAAPAVDREEPVLLPREVGVERDAVRGEHFAVAREQCAFLGAAQLGRCRRRRARRRRRGCRARRLTTAQSRNPVRVGSSPSTKRLPRCGSPCTSVHSPSR